jgi:transposase
VLPHADLSLQDEVQFAFHPTLTRVWSLKGRRGQRLVEAPGENCKVYGFGLVDWRDGWFDGRLAPGRTADVFCEQVRAAVARSKARGRLALVITDNLKTHTAQGSLLVRGMLTELSDQLFLVYTPAYDPDANRIEWHRPRLASHRDASSSPQRRANRYSLMLERTLRHSPRPLMTCFVISVALLHLTSILFHHWSLPHDQLGSI